MREFVCEGGREEEKEKERAQKGEIRSGMT